MKSNPFKLMSLACMPAPVLLCASCSTTPPPPAEHKATLEFPDGSTRSVAVRPDVKLSTTDIGREVVIRATQAVAIRVEKP